TCRDTGVFVDICGCRLTVGAGAAAAPRLEALGGGCCRCAGRGSDAAHGVDVCVGYGWRFPANAAAALRLRFCRHGGACRDRRGHCVAETAFTCILCFSISPSPLRGEGGGG